MGKTQSKGGRKSLFRMCITSTSDDTAAAAAAAPTAADAAG